MRIRYSVLKGKKDGGRKGGGGNRTVPTFSLSYLELRSLDSVTLSEDWRICWRR